MIAAATRTATPTLPAAAGEPAAAAATGFDAVLAAIAGAAPAAGEAPPYAPAPPAPIDWEAQATALLPDDPRDAAGAEQVTVLLPGDPRDAAGAEGMPDPGGALAGGPREARLPIDPAAAVVALESAPSDPEQAPLRRQEPGIGPLAPGLPPAQQPAPSRTDRTPVTERAVATGTPAGASRPASYAVRADASADTGGGAAPAPTRLPRTAPEQAPDDQRAPAMPAAARFVAAANGAAVVAAGATPPRAPDPDGAAPLPPAAAADDDIDDVSDAAAPAAAAPVAQRQDVVPPAAASAAPAPPASGARQRAPQRAHTDRRLAAPDPASLPAATLTTDRTAPADGTATAAPFTLPAAAAPAPSAGADRAPDLGMQVLTHQLGAAHDAASLDRLARDIATGAGDGPLRFALQPDALGSLGVEIQRGDDGTAIRLSTQSHASHALIVEARPQLLAEAQAQGVRISHAAVDLVPGGNTGGAAGDQARHAPPAPRPVPIATPAPAEPSPSPIPSARDPRARYA